MSQSAPADAEPRRQPALSPSRASDFKQCPLLYRLRVIDKLPESPSRAQVRGILVHTVLERLYAHPPEERDPAAASALLEPAWTELYAEHPEWQEAFDGDDAPTRPEWLASAQRLLDAYFQLEDPSTLRPEACELYLETELTSGLRLRGYVDRLDVAPAGDIRVVDYKTGSAPREVGEAKALFQMKFYAVVLWRLRGVVPRQLKLLYLSDAQQLTYTPDEAELRKFERTLDAIWQAILRAGESGDFRPNPSKLCDWCDHKPICPAYGGSPPEYPGWPSSLGATETVLDRSD
ncbi:putative RecB family exonuclease [Haloechinothrix alba]|uniref:Putative RecB family exonuclease n=1 Tax=Haloechinothrix alba TaxID=664784 RepID=A0A238X9M6_9PSEU|nr:RecB family exonuclease [Haloechinothrix alba]SNR55308.1 putative RecB family exonuclease [Haloechinothrix alba]